MLICVDKIETNFIANFWCKQKFVEWACPCHILKSRLLFRDIMRADYLAGRFCLKHVQWVFANIKCMLGSLTINSPKGWTFFLLGQAFESNSDINIDTNCQTFHGHFQVLSIDFDHIHILVGRRIPHRIVVPHYTNDRFISMVEDTYHKSNQQKLSPCLNNIRYNDIIALPTAMCDNRCIGAK